MNVAVFGASGRVGQRVVQLLLANGYNVVAISRHYDQALENERLRVENVDVHDADAVMRALQDVDEVISVVSSWGSEHGDVLSSAMRSIIPAMHAYGIKRLVSLTGTGAFTSEDKPTLAQRASRALFHKIAPAVLEDGEEHIRLLQQSDVDWTVVRSPAMNNLGKDTYKLSAKLSTGAATINRQAVAKAIVAQLSDGKWLRQTPTIWRAWADAAIIAGDNE